MTFKISNEDLAKCFPLNGNIITCPHCGQEHNLEEAKDGGGYRYDSSVGDFVKLPPVEHTGLFFYKCGEKIFLAGVQNKLIF